MTRKAKNQDTRQENASLPEIPSDQAVVQFLRQRPDFFNQHPELFKVMVPPSRWSGDPILDMQKFMLERLRDEIEDLRGSATELLTTTRANMMVQTRTHAAALTLLGASGLDNLGQVIRFDLPLMLDVDAAALCFEDEPGAGATDGDGYISWLAPGRVDELLGGAKEDVRLLGKTTGDSAIFGETKDLVCSAALARVRCRPDLPMGLFALGMRHEDSFHRNQSSELLSFLARVLEIRVEPWLRARP